MGWIKVDRQLFEHWIWNEQPFSKGQAWIDLIGLANYEDGKTPYKSQIITCERGTVYRSISFLARRWGWSRDKTRNFLRLLESDNMIRIKATTNQTAITIENYGKFQDQATTNQSTNRQRTRQRVDSEPVKEIRRIKKNKEGEEVCVETHTIPTLDDVIGLAIMLGQELTAEEAQRFIDYNAALGWKMEWQYALKRWLDRHVEKQKEQENRWGNDPDQRKEYGGEIDWGY